MKNYILIDDIRSVDDGKKCTTTSHTTICINGISRSSVVGVLASLLRRMKIDPLEILLWNSKHDASEDKSCVVEAPPEVLRAIAERRGEDEP